MSTYRVTRLDRLLAMVVSVVTASLIVHGRQQAAGTGLLVGRVVEATSGTAIGGAVVTLSIAPASPLPAGAAAPPAAQTRRAVAVANADGRFVFRDIPAGAYTIASTFEGYAPGASGRRRPGGPSRPITLADGARQSDIVISMWRLSAISGVVKDDRGEPLVGLAVQARRRVLNGGRHELIYDHGAVTDDRGHYRISGLLPGAFVVTAPTSTRTAAVSTVDAYHAAVTAGTSAAMRRGFSETWALDVSRSGLVFDGWQLSVSSAMPQPLPGRDGGVLIHPTVFYPNAMAVSESAILTIGPGTDRIGIDLTIPLVSGMRVSGVLTGPAGPAANHGMRLVPVAAGDLAFETPVAYCTTDEAGRFAFLGVPPGAYVIRAHRVSPVGMMARPVPPAAGAAPITTTEVLAPSAGAPPALFAQIPISVGSTHIDGLTVSLQPGARLSGRIAFDGTTPPPPAERLQQVSIAIRPLAGRESAPPADVRLDARGGFTTTGYAPGRYAVLDVAPPGPEWTLASVRIGPTDAAGQAFTVEDRDIEDVVVTFTDKVTTLSGEVRATESGASPEGTVVVFPANFQAWLATGMSPRRVATVVTSATGSYRVRVALPGDYLVVAVPPEIAPDVDADFVKRFSPSAVRVSLASGDARSQPLTLSRPR